MPNDRAVVPQVFDLRARIEDDGNSAATGLKGVPIAGIDPNATSVYVLDDAAQPLIVDADGDGTCDIINPNLVPTTQPPTTNNQVLKIRLGAVPAQGAPDFRDDGNPPDPAICAYPPVALPPQFLCPTNQPYVAIGYAGDQSAIWSVEPIDNVLVHGLPVRHAREQDLRRSGRRRSERVGVHRGPELRSERQHRRVAAAARVHPLQRRRRRGGRAGPGVARRRPRASARPPRAPGPGTRTRASSRPAPAARAGISSVQYVLEKT